MKKLMLCIAIGALLVGTAGAQPQIDSRAPGSRSRTSARKQSHSGITRAANRRPDRKRQGRERAESRMEEGNQVQIRGYGQLLQGWTVMNRLGEIQTPTLVLAGRYDFLFPPEHQASLADRIPDARLELIECAGHHPQDENKDVTVGIIRSFLAETTPVHA